MVDRFDAAQNLKTMQLAFPASHESEQRLKDWLVRNQNNLFGWSDMSILGQLYQ
jgi:hypothetical protein